MSGRRRKIREHTGLGHVESYEKPGKVILVTLKKGCLYEDGINPQHLSGGTAQEPA